MSDLRVPDLNQVIIAGRLTRDPELRYIASGMALCKLAVANTRYFKRKDGERGEETTFVDVTLWDKQAEGAGERLKKGRPVLVEGRLKTDQWEDKSTGQKRSRLDILARRVVPLDWEESDRGGGGGSYGQRPVSERSPAPREIEEPIPEDDIPF